MLSSSRPKAISFSFEEKQEKTTEILQKFLKFQIGRQDSGLIAAEMVIEIITITENEVLPVPQMPSCIIGVYGWRGEMLWMIDLENLLGYNYPSTASKQTPLMTMVTEFDGQFLGLVAAKVDDIVQQNLQEIHPPSADLFSPATMPFLQGHFTDGDNKIMMLLKAEEFFNSSRLQFSPNR